jgi:hypothetical protein
MSSYTYPGRDIDNVEKLSQLLGSFWKNTYTANHQIREYVTARAIVEWQKTVDLQEAIAALSRLDIPLLHADRWRLLKLKESDRNVTEPSMLRYGDNHVTSSAVYGPQVDSSVYRYGVSRDIKTSSFPIATEIKEAPLIFSGVSSPRASLVGGLDYYLDLDRSLIVLRDNPFDDDRFFVTPVYENSELVDQEVWLWVYQSQIDWEYVWKHFGYILNINLPTSKAYKRLVNAIFDGVVEGTAVKHISNAVAGICDTAVVKEDGEIVEEIVRDRRHLLIATDKHVYRFNKSASAAVAVGQTLQEFDQLVNTVQFYEFNRGQVDDTVLGVEIPKELLVGDYVGGLVFENKESGVEVGSDGVFTTIKFDVGGFEEDVTEFWEQMHARGVESPPTLAQLLDQRTNKVGEPAATNLPTTINPLKFLAENVLRHHTYLLRLKTNQFGPDASSLTNLRFLRKLVPPHTYMLILLEAAADTDVIEMLGSGDETSPGYEESPYLGYGVTATSDSLTPNAAGSSKPRLKQTDPSC